MPSPILYRVAFVAGAGMLLVAILLGLYQSITVDHRYPAIAFSNLVEVEQLMEQDRHEEAVARLEMTLDLAAPSRHLALNLLGNALEALGRNDEAITRLRQSIELEPEFAEAHNNLAIVLARSGRFPEAIAEFERALFIEPGFGAAKVNLLTAVGQFELSLGIGPEDAEGWEIVRSARRLLAGDRQAESSASRGGPSGAPSMDGAALERGRRLIRQFYAADVEELHAAFTERYRSEMSLPELRAFQRQVVEQLGEEIELRGDELVPDGSASRYARVARFSDFDGLVELTLLFTGDGSIDRLGVRLGEITGSADPRATE